MSVFICVMRAYNTYIRARYRATRPQRFIRIRSSPCDRPTENNTIRPVPTQHYYNTIRIIFPRHRGRNRGEELWVNRRF